MKFLSKIITISFLTSSLCASNALASKEEKTYKIFGRAQYDATSVEGNNNFNLTDNFNFRRARLGIKQKFKKDLTYKYEAEFSEGRFETTDAFIAKTFNNRHLIKIGNFREPFSLEYSTSSNFLTFLERSLIDPMPTDRKIGIGYSKNFDNINFYSGIFTHKIDDDFKIRDGANSASARLIYYKESENKDLIHFGGSYRISHPQDNQASLEFQPEAQLNPSDFTLYNQILDARKIHQFELETLATYKRASIQAEYLRTQISQNNNIDHFSRGYYLQFSTFLTNDKKTYNSNKSTLARIKPSSKNGAWEIAYRFSNTNLNGPIAQNKRSLLSNSFALNYYMNENVKFMTNYIKIPKEDIDILAFRAQISF